MTRFAPPSVHACPGCDAFFLQSQFRSVNFFGVQDWSDGKPIMWWRQEPLVRCNACAALFWRGDTESVGVMPEMPGAIGPLTRRWLRWRGDPDGRLEQQAEWTRAMKAWGKAQRISNVDFDDVVYVLARSRGVHRDRILWLRNQIWWRLNDRYRDRADGSLSIDMPKWPVGLERANMEVILGTLQEAKAQPWHLIQQGELLRLLGRFDEAVAVLKSVPPDGHSEVRAVKIEQLARCGDARVRLLSTPTW